MPDNFTTSASIAGRCGQRSVEKSCKTPTVQPSIAGHYDHQLPNSTARFEISTELWPLGHGQVEKLLASLHFTTWAREVGSSIPEAAPRGLGTTGEVPAAAARCRAISRAVLNRREFLRAFTLLASRLAETRTPLAAKSSAFSTMTWASRVAASRRSCSLRLRTASSNWAALSPSRMRRCTGQVPSTRASSAVVMGVSETKLRSALASIAPQSLRGGVGARRHGGRGWPPAPAQVWIALSE